ncbi:MULTISPECIES: Gp37-like protein [unclassified Microbacterium]|uniref:Gp37-like protein n=1 Tax=unclassified Microbacterium TaxID=2609290 RepID=UPI003015C941
MNASDLVVEVRDADLTRVAQLAESDLSGLNITSRHNDVGSWQLTLPDTVLDAETGQWVEHAAAQHLRKEGAGLIVTAPGQSPETLISGPMTSATYVADENDLTGKWSFTGVSDAVLLSDALAFPDPETSADPANQTRANDTRTGNAEDLIRQYVAYNIAATSAQPGRIVGLRSHLRLRGTSLGRGKSLTKSPRFQNLLELCQEIGFAGGVNFDVLQTGTVLELVITEPADRTKTIRMDMANQLLKSVTYGYGAPTTTLALVAGQGVGTERQLIACTSPDASGAEERWGRRVERFIDQRQTDDEAELTQKGNEEVLAGAASTTGLEAEPTDTDAMLYLRDWRTGDRISVVVEGQEVAAQVTEAAISVQGSAVVFVATLGNPGAFDVDAASQRRSAATSSRVSALERNAEVPLASPTSWGDIVNKPATYPPSAHTHALADGTGDLPVERVSGDLPISRTTGDLPISRTTGDIPASRVSGLPTLPPTAAGTFSWGPIPAAPSGATAEITFPPGRFATPPLLQLTSATNGPMFLYVASVTTTGASIRVSNWTGASGIAAGTGQWFATVPH